MEQEEQPRYLNQTFSSSLPSYMNAEKERINDSFRSGSYWTLRKLPRKIEPGNVQKLRHVHTTNNIINKAPIAQKPVVVQAGFSSFEYMPMMYENEKALEKAADEAEKIHIASASRKPGFWVSSRIKQKYEDIFDDIYYQFPAVLGPGIGITRLESIVREDFSDMKKFLCGKSTQAPPKSTSLEASYIMSRLYQRLKEDWPKLKFKVKLTKEDDILVQFETDEVSLAPRDTWNALSKYMNRQATHGVGAETGLRKRGDRWAKVEELQEKLTSAAPWSEVSMHSSDQRQHDSPMGAVLPPPVSSFNGSGAGPADPRKYNFKKSPKNQVAFSSSALPHPEATTSAFPSGDPPFPRSASEMDWLAQQQRRQQEEEEELERSELLVGNPTEINAIPKKSQTPFVANKNSGSHAPQYINPNDQRLLMEPMLNSAGYGEKVTKLYLTYAFYLPWANSCALNAAKAAAYYDRQTARKLADVQKERERQMQRERESLLLDEATPPLTGFLSQQQSSSLKTRPSRKIISLVLNGSPEEARRSNRMYYSRKAMLSTGVSGNYPGGPSGGIPLGGSEQQEQLMPSASYASMASTT